MGLLSQKSLTVASDFIKFGSTSVNLSIFIKALKIFMDLEKFGGERKNYGKISPIFKDDNHYG